jgi:hypothetical protein
MALQTKRTAFNKNEITVKKTIKANKINEHKKNPIGGIGQTGMVL